MNENLIKFDLGEIPWVFYSDVYFKTWLIKIKITC